MDSNMSDPVRVCTVSISGMTCQSCVRNIESTLKGKPGVLSAKVSLEDRLGHFEYDPSVTAPDLIVEHIDDMGFEASLSSPLHRPTTSKQTNGATEEKCQIKVLGMTCQSCVKNIESNIINAEGVKDIKVVKYSFFRA